MRKPVIYAEIDLDAIKEQPERDQAAYRSKCLHNGCCQS